MAETFIFPFTFGDRTQSDLLGGKGANLAEMVKIGLPVPPGFTITTKACQEFLKSGHSPATLPAELEAAMSALEKELDKEFGNPLKPLILSVRSGAKFSMPGMMETVLNVGMTPEVAEQLAIETGNEQFAWDCYRRFIDMYSRIVCEVPQAEFHKVQEVILAQFGVKAISELDAVGLKAMAAGYIKSCEIFTGETFPTDPRVHLQRSIEAVFHSWNSERANVYRRRERISSDLGTAVNIQSMVFGNLSDDSGTGVAFTRNPSNGEIGSYGDYLQKAQGEDVVAGIRTPMSLDEFGALEPRVHGELEKIMVMLESHYKDLCDIEFTIERGKLYILQTRVGKRTAEAAFRVALQLVDEGKISMDEALSRVSGEQLGHLMFPQFDLSGQVTEIARGIPASAGAAVGEVVFDSRRAFDLARAGHKVIIEKGAGLGSALTDADYIAAGATIEEDVEKIWASAQMILKVKEPMEVEYSRLRKDQILFTYLHLAASKVCTDALLASRTTAIAYETVELNGTLPLLAPMSEVAGRLAAQVGASALQKPHGGRGVLMGGVPGVAPGKVVVIGGGVAGLNAAVIAMGMGADATVLDRSLPRLAYIDSLYNGRIKTLASTMHAIEREIKQADLVIGAVLVHGARAPKLVSNAQVAQMKPASVLVDIAIDQGGCFEDSKPTTHAEPTFQVHNSIFYCVANMPGAVPVASTYALTNATLPYAIAIANKGWERAIEEDPALDRGLNVHAGKIRYNAVAVAHGYAV